MSETHGTHGCIPKPEALRADVLLSGGTVLNVYSGELVKTDVALRGEKIWYVGPLGDTVGQNTTVINVEGRVLVPGYMDPHMHPWNLYNPRTFGMEACRLGTTTLVCDNLVFFILMSLPSFERLMETFRQMPTRFFWFCRAMPQTPMANEGEIFSLRNLRRLLKNPSVQSLGEITRWQELVTGNPRLSSVIRMTKGLRKRVDGHTAGAKYENLNDIARAGVESCHESITCEEVLERLRLGFYVMLRESSLRQDLRELLRAVVEKNVLTDRIMLTTDCSSPSFYEEFGVTDNLVRIAIKAGVDPVTAYRMVTINPAVYFGMDHQIGAIAPGRFADILVLKDLLHPTPEKVIAGGRLVAEKGEILESFPQVRWEDFFPPASRFDGSWRASEHFFTIPCEGTRVSFPVIRLVSCVITRREETEFLTRDGFLDFRGREGICLLSLLDWGGAWVSNGLLAGFADRVEGLASSFNTATQVLAIGQNPAAMRQAVNRVLEIGGGIVAFEGGKVAYELRLPLGGMMSDAPMTELAQKDREIRAFLSARGFPFHDPLYTLIFLPNDFLPEVRLNRNGVVDIRNGVTLWPRRELGQYVSG